MLKFDKRILKVAPQLPPQKPLMDEVLDSLVTSKSDKVVFANASDGLHVFINGEHKGYFTHINKQMVWRTA